MIEPSICAASVSGLMTMPQSTAQITLFTRMTPSFTVTSAIWATAARRRVHGDAAARAGRHRLAPIRFRHGELHHAKVARGVGEQPATQLDRILLPRRRQLVEERLGDEAVLRMAHRSPWRD